MISGKSLSPSRDSHIFIHPFTSSISRSILCLYTSFQTASDTILSDSTTETPDDMSHENILANFESITFLMTLPNIGTWRRKLSKLYLPLGVLLQYERSETATMTNKMITYQKFTKKSDIAISAFVEPGRELLSSNISKSFGTILVIITNITPQTTTIIISGYIIADFNFHDILATFSVWSASHVRTVLSFHVFSHDLMTQISAAEKDFGNKSRHSESVFHSLSSTINVESIFLKTGFFSCFSRTHTHFTSPIHELSIVDKRR